MRESRQPSVPSLVAALGCAVGALLGVAAGPDQIAVAAGSAAFAVIAVELVRVSLPQRHADPALITRLVEQAQAGRKLAIYDRDTGLFAHWYLALRGQEECARAARYARNLTLLVIEPGPSDATAEWTINSRIGDWIQTDLRATDIAGYLGNGRYAVLAPEADAAAIERLVARLRARVRDVGISTSAFPEDGESFADLWRSATAPFGGAGSDAAAA